MPFQSKVHIQPVSAFQGDMASTNPVRFKLAPNGGYRVGKGGLEVDRFAWVDPEDEVHVIQPDKSGKDVSKNTNLGYVARNIMVSTNPDSLSEGSMTIREGIMVSLAEGGDYFTVANNDAKAGDPVFASSKDGSVQVGSGDVKTMFTVAVGGPKGTLIKIKGDV